MSDLALKFAVMSGAVMLATAGGYWCRRLGYVREQTGEAIMTFVAVFGYPSVGFLSVWGTRLQPSDAVLPVMAAAHAVTMLFVSLAMAGLFTQDRQEKGLFALAGGVGNNGFTLGAFVLYLLYGEPGMGLANIYIRCSSPSWCWSCIRWPGITPGRNPANRSGRCSCGVSSTGDRSGSR